MSRAILCPTNDECVRLNELVERLPGDAATYFSVDSVLCDDPSEADSFPLEFLNSLTPSGMPPHRLTLKPGAIIMLLRNLNAKLGLCNGTRCVVRQLMNNVIDVEVLTGSAAGDRVYIPRIDIAPSDVNLPFTLKRRQFPVRLAFAMTINKAQGQTFDAIGMHLDEPVFSHGQLYVAFSRCRRMADVKVFTTNNERQGQFAGHMGTFTRNIVFSEIL